MGRLGDICKFSGLRPFPSTIGALWVHVGQAIPNRASQQSRIDPSRGLPLQVICGAVYKRLLRLGNSTGILAEVVYFSTFFSPSFISACIPAPSGSKWIGGIQPKPCLLDLWTVFESTRLTTEPNLIGHDARDIEIVQLFQPP